MSSQATASNVQRINTWTTGNQITSSVAHLEGGGWIVTWSSPDLSGQYDVFSQRYSETGVAIGNQTKVNTTLAKNQGQSAVTGLEDGGWLVTWESVDQDSSGIGIYQQRFDASGHKIGGEKLVNDVYKADHQLDPEVTALRDGGWAVVWHSIGQETNGGGTKTKGLYMNVYDEDGDIVKKNVLVNSYTTNDQSSAKVVTLADGSFIVSWESRGDENSGDPTAACIRTQRFTPDGGKIGIVSAPISYNGVSEWVPAPTALADGGYVVVWQARYNNVSCIYQKRFRADGSAESIANVVNSDYTNNTGDAHAQYPKAIGLADGGWVVVWEALKEVGDGDYGIFQQRYDADGGAIGIQTRVNVVTQGNQTDIDVTATADGGWIVTWTSDDGSGTGIYQRHFAPDVRGSLDNEVLTGSNWDENIIAYQGDDQLNGRGGEDILIGGTGDDIYIVNSKYDDVQEYFGQGVDLVKSSVNYSIKSKLTLEHITLTGSANIDGTGNKYANRLTGNSGSNQLSGNEGNDTLTGGGGTDIMSGGTGNDIFYVDKSSDKANELTGEGHDHVFASASFVLGSNVEDLTLTGSAGVNGTGNILSNRIEGNSRNNILDGKGGADKLIGGKGNDTYIIDQKDSLTEKGGGGIDLIKASFSYTLKANFENLTLTGSGNYSGTGSNVANNILGNGGFNTLKGLGGNDNISGAGGKDKLDGGAGNDVLYGGSGADILTGGIGRDTFVFQSGSGTDHVKDFSHTVDRIDLRGLSDITSYEDLRKSHAVTEDGNTIITSKYGKVILDGVVESDLGSVDFLV